MTTTMVQTKKVVIKPTRKEQKKEERSKQKPAAKTNGKRGH